MSESDSIRTTMSKRPTMEQMEALRAFASTHGRNWKSVLRDSWMSGIYPTDCDSASLQQVRNAFGPSWLVRFRLPDPQCRMAELPKDRQAKRLTLESLELTNGEGAMVQSAIHLLQFMQMESAPVPRKIEELERLIVRYVRRVRHEQMQYVNSLRIERGQAPLKGFRP